MPNPTKVFAEWLKLSHELGDSEGSIDRLDEFLGGIDQVKGEIIAGDATYLDVMTKVQGTNEDKVPITGNKGLFNLNFSIALFFIGTFLNKGY